MFSSDCTNNYSSSTSGAIVPCSSILSKTNNNSSIYQPANCYQPLQQLYKTVYSPLYESNAPTMNIACICRPAERYKTTNMTYGSFYYDNSLSTDKNRVMNYDKAAFARCYDNSRDRLGYHAKDSNRRRDTSLFSNAHNSPESQYWTQPTSNACCPIDCCNNTTYTTANCADSLNNSTPYYSATTENCSTPNKCSNVQVRCV